MTDIPQNTTHVADALALQLDRFLESDTVRGLLEALVEEVQRVEDVAFDVASIRLSTATGDELDRYARLVGLWRNGLSDDNLRRLIRAWIAVLRANGLAALLTNALALFIESPVAYADVPGLPGFVAWLDSSSACSPTEDSLLQPFVALFEQGLPASVSGTLIETFDAPDPFGFDHDDGATGFDPTGSGALSSRTLVNSEGTWLANQPALDGEIVAEPSIELLASQLCSLGTASVEVESWGPFEAVGIGAGQGPVWRRSRGPAGRGAVEGLTGRSLGSSAGLLPEGDWSIHVRCKVDEDADGVLWSQAELDGDYSEGSVFLSHSEGNGFVALVSEGGGLGIDLSASSFDLLWHDVALVKTGTTFELWIDGTLIDSDTSSVEASQLLGATLFSQSADGEAWSDTQTVHFTGQIDALLVFAEAHGSTEVAEVRRYLDSVEGAIGADYFRELSDEALLVDGLQLTESLEPAANTGSGAATATGSGAARVEAFDAGSVPHCWSFDGVDYLEHPARLSTGASDSFTALICAAVDPDAAGDDGIFGQGDASTNRHFGIFVVPGSGEVWSRLYDDTGSTAGDVKLSTGDVRDGVFRLYAMVVDRDLDRHLLYVIESDGTSLWDSQSIVGIGAIEPTVDLEIGNDVAAGPLLGRAFGFYTVQRIMTEDELVRLAQLALG